jgi:hypothetical protein
MSDESTQTVEAPKEQLSDMDKLQLELAKSRRQTVLAQAEKALAQNESAELSFKNIVLQLYMKYHMDSNDAISEQGEILRGGAAAAIAEQQAKQNK